MKPELNELGRRVFGLDFSVDKGHRVGYRVSVDFTPDEVDRLNELADGELLADYMKRKALDDASR